MEIHIYLIENNRYRVLIYGPRYLQLFRGSIEAASMKDALTKALEQVDEKELQNGN